MMEESAVTVGANGTTTAEEIGAKNEPTTTGKEQDRERLETIEEIR